MTHKLKPYDLTNLLLKSNFEFSWELGKDRLVKFDIFVNELKSKFCVVDWGQCNEAETNIEAEKAKIELMSLCAGPQLRDIINSLISDTPILFEEMIKLTRNKLMKDTPPLLLLATLLSQSQGYAESFEDYYNRVQVSANAIDWDSFTPENIKKALIATTFASRSLNPFVKGHCLAVRDMSSINLQDMLNTAHEYEEKNPAPASFPQVGNSGSLFGSAPSGTQGGLFGAVPTGNGGGMFGAAPAPTGNKGGLFGAAPTGNGGGMFGAAPTGNGGGLFGAAPTGNGGGMLGAAPTANGGGMFGAAPTGNGSVMFGGVGVPTANGGGMFGAAPTGDGGGLFGTAPTGKGSVSYKEGRKPKPKTAKSVKCTHNYRYDKDGNLDPSSSNTGFFRGSLFDGSAPKLGFNNNIFMIDGNIAKEEEEEAAASQPSTEVEKQSSDAGPSDMAP